jgi:hypothetical protein
LLHTTPQRAHRVVGAAERGVQAGRGYFKAAVAREARITHRELEVPEGGGMAAGVRQELGRRQMEARPVWIDRERPRGGVDRVVSPTEPERQLKLRLERRNGRAASSRGVEVIQRPLILAEDIPETRRQQGCAGIERGGPLDLRAGLPPPASLD